jgi:hypothetical protein
MPNKTTAQRALIVAAIATLVLMSFGPFRPLLIPLLYLNTHIHELAHAFAALGTGGVPEMIQVFPDGSGTTPVRGGNILVIGSAGYVGASIFGAGLILYSTTVQRAQHALLGTSFLLVISLLALVRGNPVGMVSGVIIAILFAILGNTKNDLPIYAAQFIGVQQCLNSVTSVLTVFKMSGWTGGTSDATILQEVTGLPAALWAFSWVAISLGLIGWSLHQSFGAAKGKSSSAKKIPKASR